MTDSASFPEPLFPPLARTAPRYHRTVDRGRQRARESRAVIVGLARSLGTVLAQTVARIEQTGRLFRDYRVFVFENDSTDETPARLRRWAVRNRRVTVICEQLGLPHWPAVRNRARSAALARHRNRLLDEVEGRYASWDYLIVVDTDLAGGWSDLGIAHSLGLDDWDVVGANSLDYHDFGRGPQLYYVDTWAFRPVGSWRELTAQEEEVLRFSIRRRGSPPIEVWSCFGGCGIYKMRSVLGRRYAGGDVEHVTLHRQIVAGGGHLCLNPSLITLYCSPDCLPENDR